MSKEPVVSSAPPPTPPALVAPPTLAGTGEIGAALTLLPGVWSGAPAPDLAQQWRRDGVAIPGATLTRYTPTLADDLTELTCRVTAANRAGAAAATAGPIRITQLGPVAAGALFEEIFDQGSGDQTVAAAGDFTGLGLRFAVTGAGARIDAATGVVNIPTDAALPGTTVTVTARNSGGSAASGFLVTVEAAEVEPPVTAWEKLGPSYARAPYQSAAKAAVGYPPSDNEQVILSMARAASAPDRIYAGQDVGGIWVSTDNGRKWNTLRNRGLGTPYVTSVQVDPVDPNRVFALCGRRAYVPAKAAMGIFRSLDGGLNWSRVLAWDEIGEPRGALRRIAYAPSSATDGYAARWYVAFDSSGLFGSDVTATPGLVTSADGGATWSRVRNLPAASFGAVIRGCKVSPASPTVLYAWGAKGLIRFNDAPRATGSFEVLSGSGGLPAAAVYGDLHIGADGRTLIVGVTGRGVYKSSDGGGAWTRISDWAAIEGAFVNEGHPDQIYAVSKGDHQCRVSSDGGASWITDVASTPMPGESRSAYQTYIGNNEPLVLPDPRTKDRATAFANAKFFQTDDGGRNWTPASDYYCGVHHKSYAAPAMFDARDPGRYVVATLDAGIFTTKDGGRTLQKTDYRRKLGADVEWASSNGVALHPDGRTILACAGRGARGRLIRSTDFGVTWAVTDRMNPGNAARDYRAEPPRHWIGFDAGDAATAYQWRRRSTDKGATWKTLAALPAEAVITGISPVAHAGNSVLYACRIKPNRNPSPIWRSLDRGDTWTRIANPTWDLCSPSDAQTTFRVHPVDPFTIFTRDAARMVRRWRFDAAGALVSATDFDMFDGGARPAGFDASNFVVDPYDPRVMYLRNSQASASYDGNFLFMTTDSGATWKNISEGIPNSGGNGLEVHPATGVVYIGTTNGMYVRKPPYAAPTADNTFDRLRAAYPGWEDCHIDQSY